MKGLIIKSTGSWYQVKSFENQMVYEARIRGKFKLQKSRLTNPIAVGDEVEFQLESDDVAWITKIKERRNYIIRKSVNLSKQAHIIASNVDVACFIFTLRYPETSLGFLDRFLVSCEAYDIKPLILFNKIDLYEKEDIDFISFLQEEYEKIGYETLKISSYSKENLEELKDKLKDKVSVFFGHSGCGKSTLVNTLEPGLDLKTSEISETHEKGKHTTTFAQMHFWSFSGSVIDTPGVREFALIDIEKEEVQHYFPEIFEKRKDCKFYNCLHLNEPKCAVVEAVENDEILPTRYSQYIKLMEEAEEMSGF